MKYFIFVLFTLLFVSISFANEINETNPSINTNISANQDIIESDTLENINKEIFTEDILNEKNEYDITNDLNEISKENIDEYKTKINYENNEKSTQTLPTKHIYVNPNANINNQDGSSSHPYRNISYAVSQTLAGYNNIIHLSSGNHYVPNVILITKTISIIGNSKTNTNITCNLNQGFKIKPNSNLTIEKVRMQNANYSQGGAILAEVNSTININDCIFNNNNANNGAVLFTSGTGIKSNITYTHFENNTDVRYGLLHIGGSNSIFNINNCYFSNNIITGNTFGSYSGGAAIYSSNYGTINIYKCVFHNHKSNWGNAILNGNHATLNVSYSNFTTNIANQNTGSSDKTKGGAIAIGSGYAEIKNCYFYNNKADVGGAISINSGETALILSSIFQQNEAYTQGGAINNYGTLTVKNSRFIKNYGTRRGGAILDIGNNEILVENSRFVDNRVLTSALTGSSMVPQGGSISISGECHNFIIKNSTFNHSSGYYGGAIYSETDVKMITIENTLFHNNTACYGASIIIAGETTVISNNNSFNYNRALRKGGSIIINGSVQANFNNTQFKNNQVSTSGDGDGGAIYIISYSRLDFNNCNFNNNFANLKGGAICSKSVVKITISRSNITNNKATTGSGIYVDNSDNYQSQESKISIDTSSFLNNTGNYLFYSVKTYNSIWNNNIISNSWWGSNVIPSNSVYNFYVKNYFLLTITINNNNINNIVWTNNNININLTNTNYINSQVSLSFTTVKEGNNLNYPDAFLPPREFSIKENNNQPIQQVIYISYQLNTNLNKIEITLDNQKITIVK